MSNDDDQLSQPPEQPADERERLIHGQIQATGRHPPPPPAPPPPPPPKRDA